MREQQARTSKPPLATTHPVSDEEALAAVTTLIRWMGEDPTREGLVDTPKRFLKAWREYFQGYKESPDEILTSTFAEYGDYEGPVLVSGIEILSHCEHHIAPFEGVAHVAYVPREKVVGLSKIVRLCRAYARRLQLQEQLTAQVGRALMQHLAPAGVAVAVSAVHMCMTHRGVHETGTRTYTEQFFGDYEHSEAMRREFRTAVLGLQPSR